MSNFRESKYLMPRILLISSIFINAILLAIFILAYKQNWIPVTNIPSWVNIKLAFILIILVVLILILIRNIFNIFAPDSLIESKSKLISTPPSWLFNINKSGRTSIIVVPIFFVLQFIYLIFIILISIILFLGSFFIELFIAYYINYKKISSMPIEQRANS